MRLKLVLHAKEHRWPVGQLATNWNWRQKNRHAVPSLHTSAALRPVSPFATVERTRICMTCLETLKNKNHIWPACSIVNPTSVWIEDSHEQLQQSSKSSFVLISSSLSVSFLTMKLFLSSPELCMPLYNSPPPEDKKIAYPNISYSHTASKWPYRELCA